jgi:hypothetical protein
MIFHEQFLNTIFQVHIISSAEPHHYSSVAVSQKFPDSKGKLFIVRRNKNHGV